MDQHYIARSENVRTRNCSKTTFSDGSYQALLCLSASPSTGAFRLGTPARAEMGAVQPDHHHHHHQGNRVCSFSFLLLLLFILAL